MDTDEELRILHVDDETSILELTKMYLMMDYPSFNITSVTKSHQALSILSKKNNYDVIISDYQMPKMNGLELLENLRKSGNNIPFIILTGRGREEVAMKALNLGADRYIMKGSETESLYAELAHSILQIVKLRKAEIDLKESEERYRLIFENEDDSILVLDLETQIFFDVNPAAERMYGYNRAEFLQLHVNDITDEPRKTQEVLTRTTIEEKFKIPYRRNKRKDGSIFLVEFTSSAYTWRNRKLLVTIVRDITKKIAKDQELKEAKEIMRESSELYHSILDHTPIMITSVNPDGIMVQCNKHAETCLGYKPDELVGQPIFKIIHPDSHQQAQELFDEILKKGSVYNKTYKMLHKDGKAVTIKNSSKALTDRDGNNIRTICLIERIESN